MKIKHKERGQSLVELAISLTILIYLLSGAIEFGIAFFQFVQLRDAAQEGALYASLHPAESANIIARARAASTSPIDLSVTTGPHAVTVTPVLIGSACEGIGNAIEVTVSYNHQIFMPFISTVVGSSTIPLSAKVTDTILQPPCP